MRGVFRLLIYLVISGSIAFAANPLQSAGTTAVKTGCCAMMKIDAQQNTCKHHGPASDPDKQCCSGCVFCLTMALAATTQLLYPPTGGESFSTFSVRENIRPHRPLVPPPRA